MARRTSQAIKPTTMRIPPDLLKRAAEIARRQRRSRSSVINQIIAEGLAKEERRTPAQAAPPALGALD